MKNLKINILGLLFGAMMTMAVLTGFNDAFFHCRRLNASLDDWHVRRIRLHVYFVCFKKRFRKAFEIQLMRKSREKGSESKL